jgi:hypothetical protein
VLVVSSPSPIIDIFFDFCEFYSLKHSFSLFFSVFSTFVFHCFVIFYKSN